MAAQRRTGPKSASSPSVSLASTTTMSSLPSFASASATNSGNLSASESAPVESEKDASGYFLVVEKKQTSARNTNVKYRCVHEYCLRKPQKEREGWGKAFIKSHAKAVHPALYEGQLTEIYKYAKDASPAPSSGTMDSYAKKHKPAFDDEGSPEDVWKKLALCVARHRLPLSIVESPYFTSFGNALVAFGASKKEYAIDFPSPRTFVENHIEGANGLLKRTVNAVVQMHESAVTLGGGIVRSFDGATDVNKRSVEVVMARSTQGPLLLSAATAQGERKTAEWTANAIGKLLMGEPEIEEDLDDPHCIAVDEDIQVVGAKKETAGVILSSLFKLMPFVWAQGGDNAGVPVQASEIMRQRFGTTPFGCAAHAFSRTYCLFAGLDWFKTTVDSAVEVSSFFLDYRIPKDFLEKDSGKVLKRLVPTRFLSAVLVMRRLLEVKDSVEKTVKSKDMIDWVGKKKDKKTTSRFNDVCKHIKKDLFWIQLSCLVNVSEPFIYATRIMDSARAGSACLIYKLWTMLAGSVAEKIQESNDEHKRRLRKERKEQVVEEEDLESIGDPTDPLEAHAAVDIPTQPDEYLVSRTLMKKIGKLIMQKMNDFSYPVFSAAFVLCPAMHSSLLKIFRTDKEEYERLVEDALDVLTDMYRRFEPDRQECRKAIIPENDSSLEKIREDFRAELESYVILDGMYTGANLSTCSPFKYWLMRAPADSIIKCYAARIVTLDATSTETERCHKVFKGTRVKTRNRLTYDRALGLNFLSVNSIFEERHIHVETDWNYVSRLGEKCGLFDEMDERYLANIMEQYEKDEEETNRLVREGVIPSDDEILIDTVDEPSQAETATIAEAPATARVELAANNPQVSSRGRRLKPTVFKGFFVGEDWKLM